jgi:hypothetical protein
MIILKSNMNLDDNDFKNLYETIDSMRENGLIVLPPYMEFVYISEKEKAKIVCADDLFEEKEK